MSTTKSTVLVKHHLKSLKLPTMAEECEKVAPRAAVENLDHRAYLQRLCELELIERERRAAERRLKAARFPQTTTLDEFDFGQQPSTGAALDRLPHRCHILEAKGESYRLRDARRHVQTQHEPHQPQLAGAAGFPHRE
jgi:DNA replication protein DnaC